MIKRNEIIRFLDEKSSFIKGGIFDYFIENDIITGNYTYLNIDKETIDILKYDCDNEEKIIVKFDEFIRLYNLGEI